MHARFINMHVSARPAAGLSAFFIPGKRLRVHCGSPSYAAPEIVARKQYDGPPVVGSELVQKMLEGGSHAHFQNSCA
jgi:hypothetical protein